MVGISQKRVWETRNKLVFLIPELFKEISGTVGTVVLGGAILSAELRPLDVPESCAYKDGHRL